MSKLKVCAVPFAGTPEQEKQLKDVIAELKNVKGALMPVMQKAQEIYGYLPIEVQRMIAEGMDVSLEKVYGIATFYAQFTLNPKGSYQVSVCLGTACYVKGAQAVFDKITEVLGITAGGITTDGRFSFEATRCVGCCGLAPVMTINSDVYGKLTADMVPTIISKYKD